MVTYADPGKPAVGALVADIKGAGWVVADDKGRFEIRSIPKGFTQLSCRAPSLHQITSRQEIYEVPSDEVVIVMAPTGVVRGRVIGTNGKCARNISCSAHNPGHYRLSFGSADADQVRIDPGIFSIEPFRKQH